MPILSLSTVFICYLMAEKFLATLICPIYLGLTQLHGRASDIWD